MDVRIDKSRRGVVPLVVDPNILYRVLVDRRIARVVDFHGGIPQMRCGGTPENLKAVSSHHGPRMALKRGQSGLVVISTVSASQTSESYSTHYVITSRTRSGCATNSPTTSGQPSNRPREKK